jgi:hypothetical protein
MMPQRIRASARTGSRYRVAWTGYRAGFAERQTRAHPRGRVALEERGRGLPGWVYRALYRALAPVTLWYYRRVSAPRGTRDGDGPRDATRPG